MTSSSYKFMVPFDREFRVQACCWLSTAVTFAELTGGVKGDRAEMENTNSVWKPAAGRKGRQRLHGQSGGALRPDFRPEVQDPPG